MSHYSIADTERVYRIAREYVEETARYVRMIKEANPKHVAHADRLLASLFAVESMLQSLKVEWQDLLKYDHNPDWDPT